MLQDLMEQFDNNFNLHITEKNTKRKQIEPTKKTLLQKDVNIIVLSGDDEKEDDDLGPLIIIDLDIQEILDNGLTLFMDNGIDLVDYSSVHHPFVYDFMLDFDNMNPFNL